MIGKTLRIGCLAALLVASEADAGALFPGEKVPVGDGPNSVALADLDGDTLPDLVTANEDGNNVSVLLGNGDGTFQVGGAIFEVGDYPLSVASSAAPYFQAGQDRDRFLANAPDTWKGDPECVSTSRSDCWVQPQHRRSKT